MVVPPEVVNKRLDLEFKVPDAVEYVTPHFNMEYSLPDILNCTPVPEDFALVILNKAPRLSVVTP